MKLFIKVNLFCDFFHGYNRYPTLAGPLLQASEGFPASSFVESGSLLGKNALSRCCAVRVLAFLALLVSVLFEIFLLLEIVLWRFVRFEAICVSLMAVLSGVLQEIKRSNVVPAV
jgi:hypothetical protein